MKERLRQIERLSRLRASQERMREAELTRERSLLAAERQHAAVARAALVTEVSTSRKLLLEGDTVASRMAGQAALLSDAWYAHCERRAAACVERVDAATQRYRESRLQVEQSRRLADTLNCTLAAEEQRRSQALSDERFVALKHWTAGRQSRRADEADL